MHWASRPAITQTLSCLRRRVRELAQLRSTGFGYNQRGVVATVRPVQVRTCVVASPWLSSLTAHDNDLYLLANSKHSCNIDFSSRIS